MIIHCNPIFDQCEVSYTGATRHAVSLLVLPQLHSRRADPNKIERI
jgi:hypothetical protein